LADDLAHRSFADPLPITCGENDDSPVVPAHPWKPPEALLLAMLDGINGALPAPHGRSPALMPSQIACCATVRTMKAMGCRPCCRCLRLA
jgi:hypothetical protein